MNRPSDSGDEVSGEFLTLRGERYYAIHEVDGMRPFFISVVSASDHWLFVSSNGGLTAGRVSADTALFPYVTVDKVHESGPHTGSLTVIRTISEGKRQVWEPFNRAHAGRFSTSRHLYKSVLGNKICLEEINHDLQLAFRYCWLTSDAYGFVRRCELENLADEGRELEVLDGLQNILPAGTPRFAQTNTSNLVDAYKWSELVEGGELALYTLYSGITDRAEPCESLRATTLFCLGLDEPAVFLSALQVDGFRRGAPIRQETHKRGIRGAYLVHTPMNLAPQASRGWQIIADVEKSQAEVVDLVRELRSPEELRRAIDQSIDDGTDALARIMGAADAFQTTTEETVSAHHYANVLFNVLRGGIFDDQYRVSSRYFRRSVEMFNRGLLAKHREALEALPSELDYFELLARVEKLADPQLERLTREYLPITFGRRHGDPSRPWNQFAIRLEDEAGEKLLTYQGNWRDIFQNWEALAFSFPEFIESVIAKFVNASTIDGYNPYRISNEGIDWEVEDPDDPWSYIGYWGDHQIVYLLRLLELSNRFHPERLARLLRRPVFAYANVPYRIDPFESLLEDAKSTVLYDQESADRIEERVEAIGADGKLIVDGDGAVYQVNLLEKLLVPLLGKLGNFVLGGGIWMNTQRPEWNDANNALVGHGISMVTLCHMRRYVAFLQGLLESQSGAVSVSKEVSEWLDETAAALKAVRQELGEGPADGALRSSLLRALGGAASRYREAVYQGEGFSGVVQHDVAQIVEALAEVLAVIDHGIQQNQREDGLYHAYNLLSVDGDAIELGRLDAMLEGQVAALSSGAISPGRAVDLLESLYRSDIYRDDVRTFMLYPDRDLPRFLEKNRIPSEDLLAIPQIESLLEVGRGRIVVKDSEGQYRFNADLKNANELGARLEQLEADVGDSIHVLREPLLALYEKVFHHRAFTGRAGTMFGFEGLGSVYWHMVSKLLLATQECYFAALQAGEAEPTCRRLGQLYYRIREGLGFNKTPGEYGAFPTDPYSHTPKHAGAQQPGMTGQVKEEILTRFGELGAHVDDGMVRFELGLLRAREFVESPAILRFPDVKGQWQELRVPKAALAFSWCQVPFVYRLDDSVEPAIAVTLDDGSRVSVKGLTLPADLSTELFLRSGRVRQVEVVLRRSQLFRE